MNELNDYYPTICVCAECIGEYELTSEMYWTDLCPLCDIDNDLDIIDEEIEYDFYPDAWDDATIWSPQP